jgi:hypothetical protein
MSLDVPPLVVKYLTDSGVTVLVVAFAQTPDTGFDDVITTNNATFIGITFDLNQ